MYDSPFAIAFDADADGFHRTTADGLAVAGGIVNVEAPEAPAAMVAVGAAIGIGVYEAFAVFTDEAIGGMAEMIGHCRDPCRNRRKWDGETDKVLRAKGDTRMRIARRNMQPPTDGGNGKVSRWRGSATGPHGGVVCEGGWISLISAAAGKPTGRASRVAGRWDQRIEGASIVISQFDGGIIRGLAEAGKRGHGSAECGSLPKEHCLPRSGM